MIVLHCKSVASAFRTAAARTFWSALTSLGLLCAVSTARAQISDNKLAIGPDRLCVTEGKLDKAGNRLTVDSSKMRAYVTAPSSQAIAAHFTYLGPTAEQSRLGSGESRQQFGFKLHAANACNLVYAMWRFTPRPELVVSVKSNPGQTTSSQCANRGYRNIKPRVSHPVSAPRPGETHTLAAQMNGDSLRVFIDNAEVWQGSVGSDAAALNGPVGIRSDNVHLTLDLKAGTLSGSRPQPPLACKSGPEASE